MRRKNTTRPRARKKRASRTAEYVALFRAIESQRSDEGRLFEDPWAHRFLSPELAAVAMLCRLPGIAELVCRFIDRHWAGARTWAVVRTRFIDDEIERARSRIGQLVILGAGFDSRPYRLQGLSEMTVFEVDQPDTLMKKRSIVRDALRFDDVRFVAMDFSSADLDRRMKQSGYSERLRTFFLWEGVTAYLTSDAVDRILCWCARAASGSQLLFTYIDRAVLDDPKAFAGTERLFARLRASGEEWTFGLDPGDLARFLSQRGLKLERDVGCAEYGARYLPEANRTLRGYEFYRIAVATVP